MMKKRNTVVSPLGGARAVALLFVLAGEPLLHPPAAEAQSLQPTIVVVDVPPDTEWLDADALRTAISKELGAIAVGPGDPRAASRKGTLRVHLDPVSRELAVDYQDLRRIGRRVPAPADADAIRRAIVYLAGNLARDQTDGLLASLRHASQDESGVDGPAMAGVVDAGEPSLRRGSTSFAKRFWLSVSGELDLLKYPEEPNLNVCNSGGSGPRYYCINADGTPNNGQNVPAGMSGLFSVYNGRALLGADYVASDDWMLGVRFGYAFRRYPGPLGNGFYPGHIHLEAKATFIMRSVGQSQVAPVWFFSFGAASFDAERDLTESVAAWKVYGPAFASTGLGFRIPMGEGVAAMVLPLKMTLAFPRDTALSWSPDISLQFRL